MQDNLDNLKSVDDRVIIRRHPPATKDGIIDLPMAERPQTGVVINPGLGRRMKSDSSKRHPPETKIGDVVHFKGGVGEHLKSGDELLIVLPESAVLAVVED